MKKKISNCNVAFNIRCVLICPVYSQNYLETGNDNKNVLNQSEIYSKNTVGSGGGILPCYSLSNGTEVSNSKNNLSLHLNKQWHIANIIPVCCVRLMTRRNWHELLTLENQYLPRDWSPNLQKFIFGEYQIDINRDLRRKAVNWMNEACTLLNWASQTFFTAVHAWDMYITSVSHIIPLSDLATLSTACLYFGAQLIESASDENIKTLDEFMELCPEIKSTDAIREIQAHLIDTLQGVSLVSRTPIDFLLLFLGEMQIAPNPCPQLYLSLIDQNLLSVLWDLCNSVCFVVYTNGLILDGLPGSRWVAGVMFRVLEFASPSLFNDDSLKNILCEKVFHISIDDFNKYQSVAIDPMLKFVWHMVMDNANQKQTHLTSCYPNSTQSFKTSSSWNIIRHYKPTSFFDWKITIPSTNIVQEVANRLQTLFFNGEKRTVSDSSSCLYMDSKPKMVSNDKHGDGVTLLQSSKWSYNQNLTNNNLNMKTTINNNKTSQNHYQLNKHSFGYSQPSYFNFTSMKDIELNQVQKKGEVPLNYNISSSHTANTNYGFWDPFTMVKQKINEPIKKKKNDFNISYPDQW